MKRYSTEAKEKIENPKIDAFIEDVIAVCKRHGFSIGHEDGHGAFQIWPYEADEYYDNWLREAADCTPYLQADSTASSSAE